MSRPMSCIVEYNIRKENTTMEKWLEMWKPRAVDARDGEPETSAYAACINTNNPERVLVFERYDHGMASIKLHSEREAHKTLIQTMFEKNVTKYQALPGLLFYDIPGYGWWSRPGKQRKDKDTILIVTVLRFEQPWMLDKYIQITTEFNKYVWENEPDTLIYSGGIATTDVKKGDYEIKKGDFISIFECTDQAALQKHADDPEHRDRLPTQFNRAGVKIKGVTQMYYRTTGIGFMNRTSSEAGRARM